MRAGTIPSLELSASKLWVINFYQDQLDKFEKLGLGQETEFGVKITKELIHNTEKRLTDLTLVYEIGVSDQAKYQRRMLAKMKGQTNGSSDNNGSIIKSRE